MDARQVGMEVIAIVTAKIICVMKPDVTAKVRNVTIVKKVSMANNALPNAQPTATVTWGVRGKPENVFAVRMVGLEKNVPAKDTV